MVLHLGADVAAIPDLAEYEIVSFVLGDKVPHSCALPRRTLHLFYGQEPSK